MVRFIAHLREREREADRLFASGYLLSYVKTRCFGDCKRSWHKRQMVLNKTPIKAMQKKIADNKSRQ